MTFSIGIDPQKEIELVLLNLDSAVQIAPLKDTIEEPLALPQVRIHPLKSTIEQATPIEAIPLEFLLHHMRFHDPSGVHPIPIHLLPLHPTRILLLGFLTKCMLFMIGQRVVRPCS